MSDKPIIYLAHPIDRGTKPQFQIAASLIEAGCTVYNPRSAWGKVDGQAAVQEVNKAAIDVCDGVLALLPDDVPTVGTPIEIAYAAARNKPVVVIGSAILAKSPVLASLKVPVYDTDAMAISRLLEWIGRNRAQDEQLTYDADSVSWAPTQSITPQQLLVETGGDPLVIDLDQHPYLRDVHYEIKRAAEKFPQSDNNSIDDWFAIWMEEVVEATQAYNDWIRTLKAKGDAVEAGEYHNALLIELIQVGAMAARFFESLSREG